MRQHRYEEALQCYLSYYQHAHEAEARNSLLPVLFDWVELGRRYPKARQALVEIRDRETRKFAEGGGYSELFQDVAAINERLGDEDATRALFMTIDQGDPSLAKQCYSMVEPLLVKRGEYALCLRYVGNPQEAFDRSRLAYQVMNASHQRREENLAAAYRKRAAEYPDQPLPKPRTSLREGAKYGDDYFVQMTCRLIEILVGTGQEAAADKIRKQALALMDDPRVKSSVSDAKQRLAKK